MKFIVGVVNKDDVRSLVDTLLTNGYHVTTFITAGGFLRKENATLFTCVDDEQVEDVVHLIQENCHARIEHRASLPMVMKSGESYVLATEKVEVGGAVIFVFDVVQLLRA